MNQGKQVERVIRGIGAFTRACRVLCSFLVAAPVIYWGLVTNGDAYHFLGLVLLAPVAGLVLVVNSVFCLFRYRHVEPVWIGLLFLLVGMIGLPVVWYFVPHFRM